MKKIITILIFMASYAGCMLANAFVNEDLHYVITYKWGMIRKDAGEAILSLRNSNGHYNLSLVGKTKPWADNFYSVRDTLLGTIRKSDLKPLIYQKITHENGKYGKDVISYTHSGTKVTGNCKRYRNKKGKISETTKVLNATGDVFDMLSVFYFMRQINYDDLTAGKKIMATVFSGKESEKITIRNLGREKIKLRNKSEREAYHIKFNFTSGGGKKSSDDIDAWISTDSRHIPLYVVGKLPIGQVRAYYIP